MLRNSLISDDVTVCILPLAWYGSEVDGCGNALAWKKSSKLAVAMLVGGWVASMGDFSHASDGVVR